MHLPVDVDMARAIGLTTTIPVEVIYASGSVPVDLNNVFITSPDSRELVEEAEVHGYPRNICNWIKGMYAIAMRMGFRRVVGVVRGDCSNTEGLLDTLAIKGVEVYPFAYPYLPDEGKVLEAIEDFMDWLEVSHGDINRVLPEIEEARRLAWKIDEMTWRDGTITGEENHLFLVSTSDFMSSPQRYISLARAKIEEAREREPKDGVRIGYLGVPPIITDLYSIVEDYGGHIVYNEVQHQFSMPYPDMEWYRRYAKYTYPYSIFRRLEEIKKEIKKRKIEGVIHYVQSFCHRQIDDILIREELDIPVLTLEYDMPGPLDERGRIRVEAFIDLLME